jgi:hypothetical protein
MKRIAFLVCVLLLLAANTAEARRNRGGNVVTYSPVTQVAPATYTTAPATYHAAAATPVTATAATTNSSNSAEAASETATTVTVAKPVVTTASYSTTTAQGVANIMASYNCVGHWGGNPGYEGCGCGATPSAAYAICCYANSGMTTVDVGYAQSASGMWYCCRRYR